jgi:hypothetical protein
MGATNSGSACRFTGARIAVRHFSRARRSRPPEQRSDNQLSAKTKTPSVMIPADGQNNIMECVMA